ncbi:MAG: DUF3859 domain-containing protein [Candidatus Eremiobacteraeota bacterium]|nr:DUF3859 domain-containing protein [Candidatus Eremiobacteraeota bacterium]
MRRLLLLLLLVAPGWAEVTSIKIVEWGLYGKADERNQVDSEFTTTGTIHAVEGVRLQRRTQEVVARKGTRFGIQFVGEGEGFDRKGIVVRVLHPPMKNPKTGKFTTADQWPAEAQVGISHFTGWLFENDWELVEGDWAIQLIDDQGQLIDQKRFRVLLPR